MVDGLRQLAIGLLNADLFQIKFPNSLDRSRKLGSFLIKSIVKSCPQELPVIMKQLLKVSSRSNFHTRNVTDDNDTFFGIMVNG